MTRAQYRSGTSLQWAAGNPILEIAEIGYESDSAKMKVGNGLQHWNDLPYLGAGGGGGTGGSDAYYVHLQAGLSGTWVIVHNLGKRPAVEVVDSGESTVLPNVHYDSDNQLTLTFGSATSGKAYLN